MKFEWDEEKRRSNIVKHGIDFLDARQLFDGRPVMQTMSSYASEERYVTIGILDRRFVAAIWTKMSTAMARPARTRARAVPTQQPLCH